jgi:hypothetical protein
MTLDMKQQIDECASVWGSFLYFLDTWVFIEDKENKRPLKLKLWPEQRKIVPQIINSLLLILLKTRQVGLTWLSAAYVLWMAIRSPLFLAIIISASEDHAIEFLNRVYFIMDRLPGWMVPPIKSRTKMQVEFAHNGGSVATIKSMPTIEMGAESKTPNILIIDEAHTIREVEHIYASSMPGIEAAKGQVIVIANSIKHAPGWAFVRGICLGAIAKLNGFKLIFLPWMACPDRPADFRQRMEFTGMSKEDVIENYPETLDEALSAIASSYFGDSLERHQHARPGIKGAFLRDERTKEVRFEENRNGIVELWRHPYRLAKGWDGEEWERRYALGADVSEGVGSSYSIAYVKDRKVDEIVCKLRSNRISAHELAVQINMASDYYDRAVITVEQTGAGQTTVKRLEELKANQSVRMVSGRTGKQVTKEYGWHESQQSKHELCGDLRRWLKEMKGVLWDAELIGQCQTWIENETGKLGPEKGKLGDCVMAAGCTQQASLYLGPPEKIIPEGDGWVDKWQREKVGTTAWAA